MKKTIITISREFGSGGHFIGEEVAKRMNIPYYDKDIIFQIAEKTGYSESFIKEQSEYAPSKNLFAYAFVGPHWKLSVRSGLCRSDTGDQGSGAERFLRDHWSLRRLHSKR